MTTTLPSGVKLTVNGDIKQAIAELLATMYRDLLDAQAPFLSAVGMDEAHCEAAPTMTAAGRDDQLSHSQPEA